MSWQDEMHAGIARYLDLDGVVTGVDETTQRWYGCETCGGNDTIELEISWTDSSGSRRWLTWDGSLADMIRNIT